MLAELLYFSIYVLQQLGVMLGVGAQTLLLCTHLVALHRGEAESAASPYARAARLALGAGLGLIVVSGAAAAGLHFAAGQAEVLLAPAFVLKWLLVAALGAAFFAHSRFFAHGDFYYALAGGTWYALFLVHSLAPVASWGSLLLFFAAWMAVYALIWFGFVGLMRVHAPEVQQAAPAPTPVPAPPPPPPKPVPPPPPPPPKPEPVVAPPPPPPPPPKPAPPPPPPPAPKPAPPPPPLNLPVLAPEHTLTVFKKAETPPPPPPPPKKEEKPVLQEIVDHLLMPALRIMPQRPEDVNNEKRGPVIK